MGTETCSWGRVAIDPVLAGTEPVEAGRRRAMLGGLLSGLPATAILATGLFPAKTIGGPYRRGGPLRTSGRAPAAVPARGRSVKDESASGTPRAPNEVEGRGQDSRGALAGDRTPRPPDVPSSFLGGGRGSRDLPRRNRARAEDAGPDGLTVASTAHRIPCVEVVMTEEALRQFQRLPRPIQARMVRLVERLTDWPAVSGVKALSGPLAGRFRMRTGDYRLQFRVEAERIVVEKMGHRDRFYD